MAPGLGLWILHFCTSVIWGHGTKLGRDGSQGTHLSVHFFQQQALICEFGDKVLGWEGSSQPFWQA